MTTDKELLELAAKAAGYDETRTCIDDWFWVLNNTNDWTPWNPLTDDGDAFRLMVNLEIAINPYAGKVVTWVEANRMATHKTWDKDEDATKIVRLAIVIAAAEIGKEK
jgi:hypothetical protein